MNSRQSDAAVRARCVEAIQVVTTLDEDQLQLRVNDGWVSVSGRVQNSMEREALIELLKGVAGVAGVTCSVDLS